MTVEPGQFRRAGDTGGGAREKNAPDPDSPLIALSNQGIIWRVDPEDNQLAPFVTDEDGDEVRAVWAPQPGSQEAFISCPVFECLIAGSRGGGKTDALLMCFAQYVGKGLGADWVGMIFRKTYPELDDIARKANAWFRKIWPSETQLTFNKQTRTWHWKTGEELSFRWGWTEEHYTNSYHGHNVPFLGFEELTTYASSDFYLSMMSICRSARADVPTMVRSTTNPYGPGRNWVKQRFQLPLATPTTVVGPIIRGGKNEEGETKTDRVAIQSMLHENKVLLHADPTYMSKLTESAGGDPGKVAAWKYGDWNATSGGMIDDLWQPKVHVVKPFKVPRSWRIDRAFDWGSARPFSVGWWAESDGTDLVFPDGTRRHTVPGDLFLVREWYGCSGKPNEGLYLTAKEISKGIVEREIRWGWRTPGTGPGCCRVQDGPADTQIFKSENANCVADDMEEDVTLDDGQVCQGVGWYPVDKSSGSIEQGWEAIRQALQDAMPRSGLPREAPGLFVVSTNSWWLQHVPSMPRSKKNPERHDESAEDHDSDMTRYRVREMTGGAAGQGRAIGLA